MKLEPGRITMTEAEHARLDELLAGRTGSVARRDAGETGPLVVHVDGETHLIDTGEETPDG